MKTYKLVDKVAVPCSIEEWATVMDRKTRTVGKTTLPNGNRVSTVFLGLDHQWGEGQPLLFETMLFPSDSFTEEDMDRYSTYEEAVEGHWRMVERYGGKKPLTREECETRLDEDLFTI